MNPFGSARLRTAADGSAPAREPRGERSAILSLEQVGLVYEAKDGEPVEALAGVDIEIRQNEFVVILGPSGCGKSTLLKLMVGLLRPSAGCVLHRGAPMQEMLKDVGMVAQSPLLLPWRSVLDNVLLPIEILRLNRKQYLSRAQQLLESVGLAGFAAKSPRALSGGMQQRVALCRALVTDPSLLLMDEPFAALDALTRDEMARELARIWEHRRKTVVFVTHAIAEAVLLADRVVVMCPRPGRVAREIVIELPRPRAEARDQRARFAEYVETIRDLIFSFKRA
jgi:NitT/TauT family transport system ATP-binding protein